jgi:hypothetical protein
MLRQIPLLWNTLYVKEFGTVLTNNIKTEIFPYIFVFIFPTETNRIREPYNYYDCLPRAVYVLSLFRCDYRRGMDWALDLLTQLGTISNYSAVAYLHTLQNIRIS